MINQRTSTYIPLSPYLFEILQSSEIRHKGKASTLKPLPLELHLKAPTAYLRTRTYQDSIAEETCYLMAEFFATQARSIAFPELSIPLLALLPKSAKSVSNGRVSTHIKTLTQKLEAHKVYIEEKRATVDFAPTHTQEVKAFLADVNIDKSPLMTWVILQRKVRDNRAKEAQQIDNE